jgi:hypothetical protein
MLAFDFSNTITMLRILSAITNSCLEVHLGQAVLSIVGLVTRGPCAHTRVSFNLRRRAQLHDHDNTVSDSSESPTRTFRP